MGHRGVQIDEQRSVQRSPSLHSSSASFVEVLARAVLARCRGIAGDKGGIAIGGVHAMVFCLRIEHAECDAARTAWG